MIRVSKDEGAKLLARVIDEQTEADEDGERRARTSERSAQTVCKIRPILMRRIAGRPGRIIQGMLETW